MEKREIKGLRACIALLVAGLFALLIALLVTQPDGSLSDLMRDMRRIETGFEVSTDVDASARTEHAAIIINSTYEVSFIDVDFYYGTERYIDGDAADPAVASGTAGKSIDVFIAVKYDGDADYARLTVIHTFAAEEFYSKSTSASGSVSIEGKYRVSEKDGKLSYSRADAVQIPASLFEKDEGIIVFGVNERSAADAPSVAGATVSVRFRRAGRGVTLTR